MNYVVKYQKNSVKGQVSREFGFDNWLDAFRFAKRISEQLHDMPIWVYEKFGNYPFMRMTKWLFVNGGEVELKEGVGV